MKVEMQKLNLKMQNDRLEFKNQTSGLALKSKEIISTFSFGILTFDFWLLS